LVAPVSPALPGSCFSDLDWGFGGDGGAFTNWFNLLLKPTALRRLPQNSFAHYPLPITQPTKIHRKPPKPTEQWTPQLAFLGQNQIQPICNGPESKAKANVFICFMLRTRPHPLASFYGPQPMNRRDIIQGPTHMDAHQAP